jgi:cytoskeletal protein CcmA (bactofilin family)
MKNSIRFLTLFVVLALLLVPASPAYAQGPGPGGGRVIFGSNFSLGNGETFDGDLVLFGGNVTIAEGAALNGDLVVIGGRVESNGKLAGDMVVVGGQIKLEEKALVIGDVVTIGGQLQRAEGARIEGEVINNVAPNIEIPSRDAPLPTVPDAPALPDAPEIPVPSVVNVSFNPFLEFARIFGASLLMAFLGILAVLFFQNRLDRVSQAVVAQPLMTSSIGLLTIVALLVIAITIILLPFALLGLIPLGLAWLLGVVAIGQEIGDRLAKALHQDLAPVITTALGTFILVFLVSSVQAVNDFLPFLACVTWIVPVLVGLLAIGAVVITRFGARPVQSPAMSVYTPPASPPSPSQGMDEIPPAS